MSLVIIGPKIYSEKGILTDTAVVVADNVISALSPASELSQQALSHALTFPSTYHLVPGFIDLHVHGADGHDVMDADIDALSKMSAALAAEGTTAYLATTMTADLKDIAAALHVVNQLMSMGDKRGAVILGVHLEGPFLSEKKMGAQPGSKMLLPNMTLLQQWQQLAPIKLMTLAPEMKGSVELIAYLKAHHIIASIGHSNADYAEACAAIAAGCTHITHLFNAMTGIHQRKPGIVTAALLSDHVYAELIVDGVHLHPAIVELALKAKGVDKIILVTDAMRAKCLADGCYDLGGQEVNVQGCEARLADGTLAGSVLSMISAIQNMLKFTSCELGNVIKMATENPARALGIFGRKGSIALNKDADLVVLNDALQVVLTIREGQIVFAENVTA